MCNPALIVFAVSSIASYAQANSAANAQEEYQNRVFEETRRSANANFLAQAAQQNLRIRQEDESVQQEAQFTEIERARASSSAQVAAGAAGVSGLSVDALLADFDRSALMRTGTNERNLSIFRRQSAEELRGLEANRRSRISGATPQPVQRPSTLGLIASIGGIAYGYAGTQTQAPAPVETRRPTFFNQRPRGTARF